MRICIAAICKIVGGLYTNNDLVMNYLFLPENGANIITYPPEIVAIIVNIRRRKPIIIRQRSCYRSVSNMYSGECPTLEDRLFDLEKKLEAKQQESRNLADIASIITAILDIEAVLAAAMEISIRQVSGEVGAVVLVADDRRDVKISWGVESDLVASLMSDEDETMIGRAIRTGGAVWNNECRIRGMTHVTVRNALVSPIISKGTAIGAIVVLNSENRSGFSSTDAANLEMICKFTSVAIENAKLFRESLEKQKIEQELDLARQVQATFLPEEAAFDGAKVEALYIPARQVGGDYYDLIPLPDGRLFFLIGDVTNKGVPAALVMTSVYSIIRSSITSKKSVDITDLMAHLNEILCNDIIKSHGMFITLFMACLDPARGYLEYCNGGHPPPFYLRSTGGEAEPLKDGGPLVGQFPGIVYRSRRIEVAGGDRIFCYTDGVIEAADRKGKLYSISRLRDFAVAGKAMDAREFTLAVKAEIDRFSRDADGESVDDYTTIVIDITDSSPLRAREEWRYPSRLDELEHMYADLDRICAAGGVPVAIVNAIRVAVSEAMTNAVIHAHDGDASKIITITVEIYSDRVEVRVADEGTGLPDVAGIEFDPVGHPDDEGGRGLGLIKYLMDEIGIDQRAEGGIVIRMVKMLPRMRT